MFDCGFARTSDTGLLASTIFICFTTALSCPNWTTESRFFSEFLVLALMSKRGSIWLIPFSPWAHFGFLAAPVDAPTPPEIPHAIDDTATVSASRNAARPLRVERIG